MSDKRKVGYIGLGNIGKPSALHLIGEAYEAHIYDVLQPAVDELVALGAVGCAGNIHGMPLAVCLGKGPRELVEIGGTEPSVAPERTVLLGIRNLDEVEKQTVRDSGMHVFTMLEIDQRGLYEVVQEALELASADGAWLHLSFDLDSVDPRIAPGVGTPVQGGFSYREAHLVMETVSESEALKTVDLVEVNPVLDTANITAKLAAELALSAVGKRIL